MADRIKQAKDLSRASRESWRVHRDAILAAWDRATDRADFMYDVTETAHRDWVRSRIVVAEQGLFHDVLQESQVFEDIISFFTDIEHLYQHIQDEFDGLPPARFPEGIWGLVNNHEFWRKNWPLMPRLGLTVPRGKGTADVLFLYRHA